MINLKELISEKKETIKNIIILVIIILIGIYYFFRENSNNYEEINKSDIIIESNENIKNSISEEVIEEKIKVYIIGEVKSPGVIELNTGSRLEDAIILAGGTTNLSDLSKINLAKVLEDGQKIYIPSINENGNDNLQEVEELEEYDTNNNLKSTKKININTATITELCTLSGVGESLANKIIKYREENGKFKTIEDLKNVNGIGDKKYESLKDYVCVK